MSKIELALTETEFFRQLLAGENENLHVAYKDFVIEVCNFCHNADSKIVAITALVHVEVEISHLLDDTKRNNLNKEMASFIVKALEYVRLTLQHIKEIDHKPVSVNLTSPDEMIDSVDIIWNATKSDIIELAYAFKVGKCVHSSVSVRRIAEKLCKFFNIQMPDANYTYKKFCEMRTRSGKRGNKRRTYFLDKLSEDLNDHLEKLDREEYSA